MTMTTTTEPKIINQSSKFRIGWIDPETNAAVYARVIAWRIDGDNAEPITFPPKPSASAIACDFRGERWHAGGCAAQTLDQLCELVREADAGAGSART